MRLRRTTGPRTRTALATGFVTAVVLAAASCSSLGRTGPSSSASADQVTPEVSVCGLISAGTLEDLAGGRQIERFQCEHEPAVSAARLSIMKVNVWLETPAPYYGLELEYRGTDWITDGYRAQGPGRTFEEVQALPEAAPLSIDGLAGQGITVTRDGMTDSYIAWQYPDGHVLTLHGGPSYDVSSEDQQVFLTQVLRHIALTIGPVADGPELSYTPYPVAGQQTASPTPQ